ncbi:MAG: protein kinase [Gammaproteobacteria bacterium]|nr:protein kinase [Gammaproteobacteria bacterium]
MSDKDSNKTRIKSPAIKRDATRIATRKATDKTRIMPKGTDSIPVEQTPVHMLKDRFVLEEVLGVGGMGVVYKARDLLKVEAQDRDPYVAIKVLSDEFKTHPEAFISLQRESRKSQRIAHPNIVNVYDFDRDGDTVFMTMEYLDGDPLDELIARYQSTGLPTDDAWEIIHGMSAALIHAHSERIIHSDFKPGNVFVTLKGLAKVFDFGIARAVAQVEHLDDNPNDQTLFDAGNLGALTPAYASLEMLEGHEPDVRDDIYAMGCVAYEMLTGQHPYNKRPADEAERQGLTPARITHVKKSQWQAIEKAIAFRREDRLATVTEFQSKISPEIKSSNWLITGLALIFSVSITTYFLVFNAPPAGPEFSEFDIRNELELKIRIDLYKEDLTTLLEDPTFSNVWQDSVWKGITDLTVLTKGEDPWVDEKKAVIFLLYIEKITSMLKNKKIKLTEKLIENARRYALEESTLDVFVNELTALRIRVAERQKLSAKKAADAERLAQQQKKLETVKTEEMDTEQRLQARQFEVALENLNQQLKCQSSLNMRNFETAVIKLKQLDVDRYKSMESGFIKSLAACIIRVGKSFPERARDAQKYSQKLFDSTLISSISIKSRDPCDLTLAGLGSSGKRATCKDKLKTANSGPEMVVIPAGSQIKPFAIGKYEVSVRELNEYCKIAGSCPLLKQDPELPAIRIPITVANSYLKWLSQQSNKKYRLPSKDEWLHAAKSRSKTLDPNRNCALSTRGFEKGNNLVKISLGKQNGWGLVNFVGNVQEWVYASGRAIEVVGGSFREPMESCIITTSGKHNGAADSHTGFRVLREIGK